MRHSFHKDVCGKSLSTLAMNRKVLKARTRCQSILPPSWSRRCAQCLFWAKDGETLWTRMLQMLLPGGIFANESRDVRWKSRQTCSQVLTDWQPSFCATLQTATMNLRICSHHWKGLVVDSKIAILKFSVLITIEVYFSWTKDCNKNTQVLIMPGKYLMVLSTAICVC